MSDATTRCPTTEQLKALLDSNLPDSEQSAIQKHVDSCAACQKALESLVAGSQSWDAAVNQLRDVPPPVQETVLADAIRRMKADENLDASMEKSMAFNPAENLEPSNFPGSVGKLGAYEITEVIGQGGMGVVLKAFDPTLHRVVAVKVLAPYLAHNPQARKRFVREAQAIAAVSHDHVITIHGIDESAEQPNIVMQFVAGRSLQQKIDAEGSLDLKEILRIGMQTASGLAAAHAQGLVHRDVKPSNILLENGIQRVKLTDFGLARAVDDASLTQSGVIAGTPQYMAPEQANGDAVDFRADLFSLGSVMYAMCAGHSPFRASTTMGVLKRVCHDAPRPIQEINPDIPGWLSAIIMKLLQKRPEDRFATAKEVAELLEKWLAHVQQPMTIPTPIHIANASPYRDRAPIGNSTPFGSEGASNRQDENLARDRRTIFFQSVSWRWFTFFMLLGIAFTIAVSSKGHMDLPEAIVVAVAFGLMFSFFGLLLVGVGRFIRAIIYGNRSRAVGNGNSESHRKGLAPESIAVLVAIGVMLLGSHPLFAAIVAVGVATVAGGYLRACRSRPQWIREFETHASNGWQSLCSSAGTVFSPSSIERNRILIAIAWCIAGGIDLVFAFEFSRKDSLSFVTFLISLMSFALALNISSRQNLSFVRTASFIALIPIPPGALIRIPLSIVTLLWQTVPSVRDSFESTPWHETHIGRWVYGPIRLFVTFGWITAWSIGWLALIAAISVLYFIPLGPATYHVRDESRVMMIVNGHPGSEFRLAAFGEGHAKGLLPVAQTCRRQEVLIEASKDGTDHSLRLRLGPVVKNETSHRELMELDLESFFTAIDGNSHPDHAANLFAAIDRLNTLDGFPTQGDGAKRGWMSMVERITLTGIVVNRGEIDQSQAPTGFIELRTMLDPKLFLVDRGNFPSYYACTMPEEVLELGLGISIVIWLLGIGVIYRRRHFRRSMRKPVVQAVPS